MQLILVLLHFKYLHVSDNVNKLHRCDVECSRTYQWRPNTCSDLIPQSLDIKKYSRIYQSQITDILTDIETSKPELNYGQIAHLCSPLIPGLRLWVVS